MAATPKTPDRLRTMVRSSPSTAERIEAMDQLLERASRPPTRFLAGVAHDGEIPLDVRLKAVAALGANPSDAAVDALIDLLSEASQPVVRRAVERLGVLPGTSQLEALKRVRTGNAQTQAALQWAKTLVSYRNRLGEYRLGEDPPRVPPSTEEAEDLTTRPLPRSLVRELEPKVAGPVLGMRLTTRGGRAFDCGGRNFVALLAAEAREGGPSSLREAQALPAVVLQRSLESGEFVVSHVVLTDPERGGGVRVHLARRSGSVVMTGTARPDGEGMSFELTSTRTPYLPPTRVSGRLDDGGALTIDHIVTTRRLTPAQQRLTKTPTRQVRPD